MGYVFTKFELGTISAQTARVRPEHQKGDMKAKRDPLPICDFGVLQLYYPPIIMIRPTPTRDLK